MTLDVLPSSENCANEKKMQITDIKQKYIILTDTILYEKRDV
jgi:hypothetical protein